MDLDLTSLSLLALSSFFVYNIGLVVYRLTLHPLAGFPGPNLAAASYLYELYFDVISKGGGQYTNKVDQLHERLGPIVRVTPDEVHVRDAEWASVLYAGPGKVRIKDPRLSEVAGTGNGCFGTSQPQSHRRRRSPVHAFYSRNSISRMQAKIWQQADRLCDVLARHLKAQSIIEGRVIFLGWSNDSLRTFTFGSCLSLLENVDKAREFQAVIEQIGCLFGWLHFAPWIIKMALGLPPLLFEYIKTPFNFLIFAHVDMVNAANDAHVEHQKLSPTDKDSADLESGTKEGRIYEYMFQAILGSSLPDAEKRPQRLAHEGLEMLLAGSDPAARTMCVLFYHVNANRHILENLRAELKTVIPNAQDACDIRDLENLPYLNACVKEALRLGQTTDHRFGLIAPEEDLVYHDGDKSWVMPRGVTVSMTPARAGIESKYFPDPRCYKPERWMASPQVEAGAEEQRLALMNKAYMPFAKGTRNCLGEFFAMTEIRVAVATIFRRFDFDLYDTIRERDVDVCWNHISGEPSKGSKGIKFKVVGTIE